MQEKELLRKLGEETIYSAKGHFKACDLRRQLVTYTIWGCVVLNILGVWGINPSIDKALALISLFGTIALLLWNEGEGKNFRAKHKEAAEKYLALHKEIRSCYFLSDCDKQQVELLSKTVIQFDQSEKPEIPTYARKWAKKVIEGKNPETDNWFLKS
ncbi:MAG: hypothetical protein M9940_03845 [Bacteroidetes bacterium]|nr:hypothetical protein [Bacteroidia bacterium]MCO5288534.1 hypothetical protein [Bacteroidota bacterium]